MGHRASPRQPDLFARAPESQTGPYQMDEPPPPDFIARIRGELQTTLARARDAECMPWRDLTAATLAELRFNSIADWLPPEEAASLREAFAKEMVRLWDVVTQETQETP